MKKLTLFAFAMAAAVSSCAFADGADDELLSRNRVLDKMKFDRDKLREQATMAKSWKDMIDAGIIVDTEGNPMGVGDMERLALEVRRRGGVQATQGFNPSDPFGGAAPVVPMPAGQSLFGDPAFGPAMPVAPQPPKPTAEEKVEKVEVVEKPSEREKSEGKQILRLAEIRANTAKFFTNDGFKLVSVGESVYEQRLASISADCATLKGKDGNRVVCIDWTKSVRYADD